MFNNSYVDIDTTKLKDREKIEDCENIINRSFYNKDSSTSLRDILEKVGIETNVVKS